MSPGSICLCLLSSGTWLFSYVSSELKLRSSGLRDKHFTNWTIPSGWGIIILIKHNKSHCFGGDGPPCHIASEGLKPILFLDLLSQVRSLPNRRELPLQEVISVSENMCWFYIWYLVILQTALANSTSWCKILQVTIDKLLRSHTIWPPRHKPSLAETQLCQFIRVLIHNCRFCQQRQNQIAVAGIPLPWILK